MRIEPVDSNHNLYSICDCYSKDLVEQILATPWLDMPWEPQSGQESWPRRRIDLVNLPWRQQWEQETRRSWFQLSVTLQRPMLKYDSAFTYFWLDMPGFTCDLHTDGQLPGAIQLAWHGHIDLSTRFYHDQDCDQVRMHKDFCPNSGYIMVNRTGSMYESGLWHDMPVPVPKGEYRVSSYTLLHFL